MLTEGMRLGQEQEPAEAASRVSSWDCYKCREGCGRKVTHRSVLTGRGMCSRKESFSQLLERAPGDQESGGLRF